jgi:AraC-like DNA-binding protein
MASIRIYGTFVDNDCGPAVELRPILMQFSFGRSCEAANGRRGKPFLAGDVVDNLKLMPPTTREGGLDDLRVLADRLSFASAVLVSVMPHGRLQIVRASLADPEFVRRYNREDHACDQASWAALRGGQLVIDSPGPFAAGRCVALPTGDTVLAGYPSALHVCRREHDPAFSDADLAVMREALDEIALARVEPRVFVLGRGLVPLLDPAGWAGLDPSLRAAITAHAGQRLEDLNGDEPMITDRRTHPLEGARRQAVRYVFSRDSAAHPGQPGVVVCLQPSVDEWAALSSEQVPSHAELSRFLPALQFMRSSKNATLHEVAASVGLSPFHFHRRFVELTGMAPKQYLFDCQIADAQAMLLEGRLELYAIARKCGFAHQSHFTSRFRQATGLTPTRWRKAALPSA